METTNDQNTVISAASSDSSSTNTVVEEEIKSKPTIKKRLRIKDETYKQMKEEHIRLQNELAKLKREIAITKHGSCWFLREIVKEQTGNDIIKATPELLEECKLISIKAYKQFVATNENNLLPCKRINEGGNYMETMFDKVGDDRIIKPVNSHGNMKATGYPDREIMNVAYLEVKLIKVGSEESTLRSFYMSTLDKITKSQPHILIAFKHENGVLSQEMPTIIDLYDIRLTVKVEYNTNNKSLYKSLYT
ncbi:hypothetical protein OAA07_00675 [bacterium]|nr:hypothetical protein [bacterium]